MSVQGSASWMTYKLPTFTLKSLTGQTSMNLQHFLDGNNDKICSQTKLLSSIQNNVIDGSTKNTGNKKNVIHV